MGFRHRGAYLVGTWFGLGNAKHAPGTIGSLGAIPLHFILRNRHPLWHIAVTAALTGAGVWASQRIADDRKDDDPQLVVIDEVAGSLIAMGLVRSRSTALQLAAWILFRVFDIWKPGPVSRAERMKPKGIGIMADDVLAGVIAGALARWL